MSKTKPKTPKTTLEAIRRYNDKNIVQIHLALNRKTDADILAWLEQKKNKLSGDSKVSSICYEDIQDAIKFCKKRSDYVSSKSAFIHEGTFTQYIITEARCEAKKDNG